MSKLIDREDLLKAMRNCEAVTHSVGYSDMIAIIEDAPEIKPKPRRRGRWIPTEYDSYADCAPVWDKWECCECGHEHKGEEDTLTAFCPDCGTRMDGGADNANN